MAEGVAAIFVEEQRNRQVWLWGLLLPATAFLWYAFWQQIVRGRPFGHNPAPDGVLWLIWALFGVGLPWLLYAVRLRVEVRDDDVQVAFATPAFPLLRKTVRLTDIARVEARTYAPLWDYGGGGVRWGWARGWAYTMSGDRGVRLYMRDGSTILIGSQQPEQLAVVIEQAAGQRYR